MYYPPATVDVPPAMISTLGPWGTPISVYSTIQTPTSSSFEGSNVLAYLPINLPVPVVARRVWWANGSTVSATYNISVAIYASTFDGEPGAKIVECASTAQGTASQVQFVDITDTYIPAGVVWVALACSSSSATILRSAPGSGYFDASARFSQASITVGSLPATATPVESTTGGIYLCGFATTASP